jgi:Xaa-Pro aminopeptidase
MKLTTQERDRRHAAIRKMMEEKDLSVLVAASNAMWTGHVRYLSNYPPHFGYSYVVFPREGAPTLFVFSKIQEQVAAKRWISDARQTSNYPEAIVKRIKELDCQERKIGLVGVENMSFPIYEYMKKELPSSIFVNANKEIFDLRMIKSPEEQAIARECALITDRLYSRIKEVVKVGMSEFDIYAEMDYFMRKQGVESAFNLIGTGLYPIAPFLAPSGRVIQEGESLLVERRLLHAAHRHYATRGTDREDERILECRRRRPSSRRGASQAGQQSKRRGKRDEEYYREGRLCISLPRRPFHGP